ncbi:Wzz/FepE/Etk N-terminal domain-containing protein [Pelomonas sp. CA6]|uniref:Wzz/FepE/Etk N-terminal domain-containing protein n=1 Tax=Pelomonas sp. CA6 TaxID=2907999 RepID=UPI001F4C0D5A|nr:Wzz/FepE/Etk N-terminal domain-containing protein [Pelomonas sp. CA6]MCH7344431.1 Wzz/FepE/Etk N-terminal domain-containing protein [Pelomonas sp. CA6]
MQAARRRRGLLIAGPLAAAVVAAGISMLLPPGYTAKTSFLPPQQQQSSASSALASLSALSGLGSGLNKNPVEQYVALMQSDTVSDRIIEGLKLDEIYKNKFKFQNRKELGQNTRIISGKKDGLIIVEADGPTPELAAAIANRYVDELRRISGDLALTEAKQRRIQFESELAATQKKLVDAQLQLQQSGINPNALKTEPKAALEQTASLQAQLVLAQSRLSMLRSRLSETSPDVQSQKALIGSLSGQLAQMKQPTPAEGSLDYVAKYREFKYQETLYDLYAKQFELARLDESRDNALIQVVDPALLPEQKSKPKRSLIVAFAFLATLAGLLIFIAVRDLPKAPRRT